MLCTGDLSLNLMFSAGTKERNIPVPTGNPMTDLFALVSCPNYTYEVSVADHSIFLMACIFTFRLVLGWDFH